MNSSSVVTSNGVSPQPNEQSAAVPVQSEDYAAAAPPVQSEDHTMATPFAQLEKQTTENTANSKEETALEFPEELYKVNCMVNTTIKSAICIDCQLVVPAPEINSHAQKHKFKYQIKNNTLEQLVETYSLLCDNQSSVNPAPGLPYIEGLQVHAGMICSECKQYACLKTSTMQRHHQIMHRDITFQALSSYIKCDVQRFNEQCKFFAVVGKTPEATDLFGLVDAKFKLGRQKDNNLQPPMSVREIVPLLQMTRWMEYLGDWHLVASKRKTVLALTQLPTRKTPSPLHKIHKVAYAYLAHARKLCEAVHDLVRKNLLFYPA